MPYINFNTIPHSHIWDGVHGAIAHSDQLTFAHIILEQGAIVGEHHHMHEQWTHVLEGQLEFNLGGDIRVMTAGITAYIPSDMPHSAKALTRVKVIDCFMPVREDFKSLEPWAV